MFFDAYQNPAIHAVRPHLLWEYDLQHFDYQKGLPIVVQRVVERGNLNDWLAILNLYGSDKVIETIKAIPYMNDKDMNFVHVIFSIPLKELQCYKNRQSKQIHWNS